LITLPPPPRSPLLPYTTLFRSHLLLALFAGQIDPADDAGEEIVLLRQAEHPASLLQVVLRLHEDRLLHAGVFQVRRQIARQKIADRKSTRLNSSHLVTSYAVFC